MTQLFSRISSHTPSACTFILLIGFCVCFWDLGGKELFGEEGRRALCAQDYIQTGTYLVPDVHGEPYLNKPPGYPWLIVLSSYVFGGINEWSVRFPSACLTVITALLIYTFAAKKIPPQIRFLSALIFFATFEVIAKGRMGETDASLMCFGFASVWCWWLGFQKQSFGWFILSGIMLAGALLMKGPPALIFCYGTILTYCISQKKSKWLISTQHAVFISTTFFFTCLWLLPFLQDISAETLAETGSRELLRSNEFSILNTLTDQLSFTVRSAFAFLPSSIVILYWCSKTVRRQHDPYLDEARFLVGMIVTGFIFFFLFPETRIRYILPLAPALSLVTAMILFQLDEAHSTKRMKRIIYSFGTICCWIAAGGIAWGLWRMIQPYPNWITPVFILLCSAWLFYRLRFWQKQFGDYNQVCLQMLTVILFLFVINHEKIYQYNQKTTKKQLAQNVQSFVENQSIYINYEGSFNFFYYLGAPVQRIYDINEVPSDEHTILLSHYRSPSNVEADMNLIINNWKLQSTQTLIFDKDFNLYLSTLIRTD